MCPDSWTLIHGNLTMKQTCELVAYSAITTRINNNTLGSDNWCPTTIWPFLFSKKKLKFLQDSALIILYKLST